MSLHKIHTVPDYDMPRYHTPPKKKKVVKPVDAFAFSHEDKLLKQKISSLGKRIDILTRERAEALEALKKRELLRNQNSFRPVQLYALRLEDNCWYIGMSYNPVKRFVKHSKGKGAQWTKVHPPIEIHEIRSTKEYIQDNAAKLEDDLTLEYAMKYGSQYVRGGGYCQAKPKWPQMIRDNEIVL